MVDQTLPGGDAAAPVCPWCSAALTDPAAESCPSCGAILIGGPDETLPGLTAVDPSAIVRASTAVRPRSRLLSWLSGESDDDVYSPAQGQALAPPDLDVRREMLRLELEAEVAALQAENEALLAEAAAEGRIIEIPTEIVAESDPDDAETDDAEATAETDAPTAETDNAETSKPA